LAGALDHAERQGFDHVLSCGCDIPDLPPDLLAQLGSGPSIVDALPIVGLWPAALAPLLKDWMANSANRSVYRFANHIGARRVALHLPLTNVNHPEDLQ
jgi:molybdopterin-guanine dinucleotide biosynthesis protein A